MSAHLPRLKAREGLADTLKAALGAAYVAHKEHVGELTVTVDARRDRRGVRGRCATSSAISN